MNQEMSGSGLPLAAQSMVAVRVRSTTFNCGPMSMVGKPGGSWSSAQTRPPLESRLTRERRTELILPGKRQELGREFRAEPA